VLQLLLVTVSPSRWSSATGGTHGGVFLPLQPLRQLLVIYGGCHSSSSGTRAIRSGVFLPLQPLRQLLVSRHLHPLERARASTTSGGSAAGAATAATRARGRLLVVARQQLDDFLRRVIRPGMLRGGRRAASVGARGALLGHRSAWGRARGVPVGTAALHYARDLLCDKGDGKYELAPRICTTAPSSQLSTQ
jgi:hypothetical protein